MYICNNLIQDNRPVKIGLSDSFLTEIIDHDMRNITIHEYHSFSLVDHVTNFTTIKWVSIDTK